MSATFLKKGVERVLLDLGFTRFGKTYRRETTEVATLFSVEKGFGGQWFFNVGFWLIALGGVVPTRVELAHLYLRLERLFPEHRDTIVMAGATGESEQHAAFVKLCQLLAGPMESRLRALATTEKLRTAVKTGELGQGLLRKEAREYLAAE